MKITEFEIPVAWGVIAVKAWGEAHNEPILTIHGVQDNAASFDRLIPLLPRNFYYICIDLPGHGKSSHFPGSFFITGMDFLVAYKVVFDHINQKPINVLAHSYGAHGAFVFAILYPECVKKLILLDSVSYLPVYADKFKTYMKKRIEIALQSLNTLEKNKVPTYTYDEAVKKLTTKRIYGTLTNDSADALLKRHLMPVGADRYSFTLDQRLKYYVDPQNDENYIIEVLKNNPIRCPVMVILLPECASVLKFTKPIVTYLKTITDCTVHYICGGHNEHINNPEKMAPLIKEFLINNKL